MKKVLTLCAIVATAFAFGCGNPVIQEKKQEGYSMTHAYKVCRGYKYGLHENYFKVTVKNTGNDAGTKENPVIFRIGFDRIINDFRYEGDFPIRENIIDESGGRGCKDYCLKWKNFVSNKEIKFYFESDGKLDISKSLLNVKGHTFPLETKK